MAWPEGQGRFSDAPFKGGSLSTSQGAGAATVGHSHRLWSGTHRWSSASLTHPSGSSPRCLSYMPRNGHQVPISSLSYQDQLHGLWPGSHHNVASIFRDPPYPTMSVVKMGRPQAHACEKSPAKALPGAYPLSAVKMTSVSLSNPRSPTVVIRAPTAESSSIRESPNGPRPEYPAKLCPLNWG